MEGAVQPGGAPGAEAPGADPTEPGQGSTPETPDLYSEILDGIPGEYHQTLSERLKEMDGKATQKFQSHAERVKPYEEAGVFDADPERLSGWMNLESAIGAALGDPDRGVAPDPAAQQEVAQWVEQLGEQLGIFEDDGDTGSEGAQDLLDFTPDQLEEMIGGRVTQATQPLLARMEQQEQDRLQEEAKAEVTGQMQSLRQQHPNLTDADQEDIMGLAFLHGQESDDPISVGFEHFQRMAARGENNLFAQKVDQPAPAEGGGLPNTAAPSFEPGSEKEHALERLRQMQAT